MPGEEDGESLPVPLSISCVRMILTLCEVRPETCPSWSSSSHVHYSPDTSSVSSAQKAFVADPLKAMDFCTHKELLRQNGEFIMESKNIVRPLAPLLAVSRVSGNDHAHS